MKEQCPGAQAVAPERQSSCTGVPEGEGEGPEAARDASIAPAVYHAPDQNLIGHGAGQRETERYAQFVTIIEARTGGEKALPITPIAFPGLCRRRRRRGALREHGAVTPANDNALRMLPADGRAQSLFHLRGFGAAIEPYDAREGRHWLWCPRPPDPAIQRR